MKLYTDPGNFQTVKILLAAELAKVKLDVKNVKSEDCVVPYLSTNKLPVLEVYPEKFVFSVNAASRLVFNQVKPEEDESQVDQWLDWESACLYTSVFPYLQSALVSGKVEESLAREVKQHLAHIEQQLKGKKCLAGTEMTIADVIVWSTLYPALTGKASIKGWEQEYSSVQGWFTGFLSRPEFRKVVDSVYGGGGDTAALKPSLTKQPAPLRAPEPATGKRPPVQRPTNAASEEPVVSEKVLASAEEIKMATDAWLNGSCPKPVTRQHPILPVKGKRNILITSALPYVNNVPHLGNIIGCVLSADVFSRYCRLRNYNCIYVCGTDEYGTATETKAIAEGVTPQQICDKYSAIHQQIYDWFNIDFDHFGRTTNQHQTRIAQDIFWKLHKRGYVLQDSVEQLHCQKCDRFLADRFVEGTCPLCGYEDARGDQCDKCGKLINAVELIQPKCKLCQSTPEVRTSQHLFLDLPKVEGDLQGHLDKVFKAGVWTNNAKVITNSWIRDGLKPRCISRDLKWGTPVPLKGYTDKVFYVWFDAPIGYISITASYTDKWEQWWKNPDNVEMYNFLGKDNVPFHSVIFPATLLGANDNYTVVNHMSSTEYLNYEDGKFSKSRGTGVFGNQAKETGIPADVYRFYLLYVRPESQDSSFSWDDLLLKNNSELLNNLGNFINRALMFVSKNFGGVVQEMSLSADDYNLVALVNRELKTYIENMEATRFRDSIRNILNISRLGNQYMQENQPWVLAKGTPDERSRAGTVVSLGANVVCLLSVLLQPCMPSISVTIQRQLNAPPTSSIIHETFLCHLRPGHTIGQPSPLFEKIEASAIEEYKKKFGGDLSAASKQTKAPVKKGDVIQLTAAVTAQGNKVRELKGKKVEKSVIDTEVKILLDLKKQLAEAQGQDTAADTGAGKKKTGKQSKGAKQPETQATPAPTTNHVVDTALVESLTQKVTEQGNKVRQLKTEKADKGTVDAQVAVLLDLKKQLSIAQGQDPAAVGGGGKKKGKK